MNAKIIVRPFMRTTQWEFYMLISNGSVLYVPDHKYTNKQAAIRGAESARKYTCSAEIEVLG